MLKCDKCDFISQNNEYFSPHMNSHKEKRLLAGFSQQPPGWSSLPPAAQTGGAGEDNKCDRAVLEINSPKPNVHHI